MTVVVDASIATKWFVSEAGREQALTVLDEQERHAPALIVAEVGNVAWKKAMRGQVTGDHARFICISLRRYFAELHPSEALAGLAIDMALHLRHPIYDCLYLACARRTGARLVTADRRLLSAIERTDLAALAVHVGDFAAAPRSGRRS